VTALWRKAPLALRHHPTVAVAVAVAALLVALASSSSPLVGSAAASSALKNKLDELTPFVTGLQIRGRHFVPPSRTVERMARDADARDAAVRAVEKSLGSVRPPVAALLLLPNNASSPTGSTQVRLLARTDALAHVRVLDRTDGPGVWIADLAARGLHVKPGGTFELSGFDARGRSREVSVRVKGIYRALAYEAPRPYWANFYEDVFPLDLDSPPPPTFLIVGRGELFRLVHALGAGAAMESIHELPVDPRHLTLPAGRDLADRFAAVRLSLTSGRTAAAEKLCPIPRIRFTGAGPPCDVLSSLPSAVTIADANVDAVAPAVTLLSTLGAAIALAVAAAAGAFAVRRRRVEAALRFARGEHVAAFSARTLLEALLPALAGAGAGFALAVVLTGSFAPSGTIDDATFRSAAWRAAAAGAAALCVLTLAAAVAFVHQYDTGARRRRLGKLPWELPLLGVAIYLLVDVRTGGGLAKSGSSGAEHPTLAVFLFPLVLVAAVAGLAVRLARLPLRPGRGRRIAAFAVPVYLALRRLAAARGLLVVLTVVSAVSLGSFFYAEALAASLKHTTDEKAYISNGGDVAGIVQPSEALPRGFPFPLTKVEFGNGAAAANTAIGHKLDVLVVDPATLPAVLHWEDHWGPNPARLLAELEDAPATPLPVIVTSNAPPLRALSLQARRVPVTVLGRVQAFPGMTSSPLVVTSADAFARATAQAHVLDPLGVTQTYVWGKGPPEEVGDAMARAGVDVYFATTVDTFRRDPDVLLATRTYGYLRATALASAVLVLVGLLLYLQARQRSQAIASALAARMGFRRAAEILSLCLEVAAIGFFALAIGATVALLAAGPVVREIDPLPDWQPSPIFVAPLGAVAVAAAVLAVVALVAGAVTSWLARRTDVSEALRVA
jgi:putative ABC transport system permease protein